MIRRECLECGRENVLHLKDDYLCIKCRYDKAAYIRREVGTVIDRILLAAKGRPVIVRDDPESPWVEIDVCDNSGLHGSLLDRVGNARYACKYRLAVWQDKDVYKVGIDGSVEDDPIDLEEVLAALTVEEDSHILGW